MPPKKLSSKPEAVRKRRQFADNPLKQPWINLYNATKRRQRANPHLTFLQAFDDVVTKSKTTLTPEDLQKLKVQAEDYARLHINKEETRVDVMNTMGPVTDAERAQIIVSAYELLICVHEQAAQNIMRSITDPINLLQILKFDLTKSKAISLDQFCDQMCQRGKADVDVDFLIYLIGVITSEEIGLFRTFLVLKMMFEDRIGIDADRESVKNDLTRLVECAEGEFGSFILQNDLDDDARRIIFRNWVKCNTDIVGVIEEYAKFYWGDGWCEDLWDT